MGRGCNAWPKHDALLAGMRPTRRQVPKGVSRVCISCGVASMSPGLCRARRSDHVVQCHPYANIMSPKFRRYIGCISLFIRRLEYRTRRTHGPGRLCVRLLISSRNSSEHQNSQRGRWTGLGTARVASRIPASQHELASCSARQQQHPTSSLSNLYTALSTGLSTAHDTPYIGLPSEHGHLESAAWCRPPWGECIAPGSAAGRPHSGLQMQ